MPAAGQDTPYFISSPAPARVRLPSAVFFSPHEFQSRTPLTKQAFGLASSPLMLFNQAVMLLQPADPVFGNSFPASNKDYLFVYNSHATLVRTVTLRSYPEPNFGRVGDVTVQIQPGEHAILGPIVKLGWMWPDGNIYVDGQTSDIQLLPATIA